MGNYEQLSGLMRGGRPVYRLEGNASKFLFFLHICSDWAIGEVLPTASQDAAPVSGTLCALFKSSLKSKASPTACPHQAASWNVNGVDGWTSSYSVAVFAPGAPVAAACSELIYVKGAEAEQLSSMGRFYMVPRMTLGGRPVYARDYYPRREGRFLFYSPNTANWYIGPWWGSYASTMLRSTGASAAGCPDEASVWEVSVKAVGSGLGAWTSSVGITVSAPAGMTSTGEDLSPPARACSLGRCAHSRVDGSPFDRTIVPENPTVGSWQASTACPLQIGYGRATSTAPLAESVLTLPPMLRSRERCPTCSEACRAGTASFKCTRPQTTGLFGRLPEAFAPQENQRHRRNASEWHHPREPLFAHSAYESVSPTHSDALIASRLLAAV